MKPWRVVKAVEKVVKGKGRLKIYLERRGDGYRVQLWRQGTIFYERPCVYLRDAEDVLRDLEGRADYWFVPQRFSRKSRIFLDFWC